MLIYYRNIMDTSLCFYFQISIRSPKKISNDGAQKHFAASPADATDDDVPCMGTAGSGDGCTRKSVQPRVPDVAQTCRPATVRGHRQDPRQPRMDGALRRSPQTHRPLNTQHSDDRHRHTGLSTHSTLTTGTDTQASQHTGLSTGDR